MMAALLVAVTLLQGPLPALAIAGLWLLLRLARCGPRALGSAITR